MRISSRVLANVKSDGLQEMDSEDDVLEDNSSKEMCSQGEDARDDNGIDDTSDSSSSDDSNAEDDGSTTDTSEGDDSGRAGSDELNDSTDDTPTPTLRMQMFHPVAGSMTSLLTTSDLTHGWQNGRILRTCQSPLLEGMNNFWGLPPHESCMDHPKNPPLL